ncbi:MAG TPA: NAD(P)-dependent alcohol dehydrogenase [Candidatus Baltobacteraceae bacterium]|jgi:NADPH:quinone reductase-like Zn-dependent oxidoreductase|nr:NAD(P)-dependent alcohol dehydrogenase [Candidatus Baltobacteraceae bacterium]
MTQTMRAVRLHEIGGPQNLRIDEIPVPHPAPGEVVVRVRAAAFNRRDVFITQGLYPKIELPVILGSDGAGEVAAVGDGVSQLREGDAVVIDPMLGWGDDPHVWDARSSSIVGMPHPGTFAQYVAVPAVNVYPKPRRLSMQETAAIPLAGLTAYRATFTRGELKAGQTVLITGVGGGVQTFVLLFAKQAGARAIVTSGSDEKLERAKALGADEGLNYRTDPDWHKTLRSKGPIDLVVDSSGGDTLAKAIDAVRPGGRIAIYGGTNLDATIKLFPLFWKHVTIAGTSMGSSQDFDSMLELFEEGNLRPAIDQVFAMNDVVAAAQRMASSNQFGKIVLDID